MGEGGAREEEGFGGGGNIGVDLGKWVKVARDARSPERIRMGG